MGCPSRLSRCHTRSNAGRRPHFQNERLSLKIHLPAQEKKFLRRSRLIHLVLRLARIVRGKPITRLIQRTCHFNAGSHHRLELVAPFYDRLLMHLDVDSWIERKILCSGSFEPWIADFLTRSLKPGYVAIDVGANSGCHSLVMASAVGQGGRVLAFEPNPRMFARLQSNLRLNRFTHVDAFSIALSREPGQQNMFVPRETDHNQGLGSLHRANLNTGCQEVSVTVNSLDRVVVEHNLERVDLIKIDVEGHEYQVFQGALETLAKFKPILVFEFSERQWRNGGFTPADVEKLLGDLGYDLYVMRRDLITSIDYGVASECDLLALPR